ncbi:uncharacterized protein LOC120269260 [Dioscorea cayenensis subsp. rotundata]|uniref:Uncharacterized protein LOC120269260 n=1 Tax=Dioscorea cayennensis subsp. rotundata TaxID=55577 RepID=A0AB40C249_DIOCR|nr:uncharacterized protein LOC120269260 [Dioscorea cayenensis subsp. rotundata]
MFEIPIAYKPVFLNMDLDVTDCCITDFIENSMWSMDALNSLFGPNWSSPIISHGKLVSGVNNHWLWFPDSKGTKISSNVYNFLTSNKVEAQGWCGWSNIWKLNIAPKAKHFIWLLNHVLESADHLFRSCPVSLRIWRMVELIASIKTNLVDLLTSGAWLDFSLAGNSKFVASIIASTIWHIWKCRCNFIFRQERPDFCKIANWAVLHVQDFLISPNSFKMQNYLMNSRPHPGFMGIFSAAAWNSATGIGGLGFVLIDSNANVCCAGCVNCNFTSSVDMELKALNLALSYSMEARLRVSNVYISSVELWKALHLLENEVGWRHVHSFLHLRELLQLSNHPSVEVIPHQWNRIAAALAGHSISFPHLSLFHRGLEKPKWLMELISHAGFS